MSGTAGTSRGSPAARRVIHLLDGPCVVDGGGDRRAIPVSGRRLVAFLALRRGSVERAYAAGSLWPTGDDRRAQGNLRSSLWRLHRAGVDVIVADKWSLALADDVDVDVTRVFEWAQRLIRGEPADCDLQLDAIPRGALDLLPGWYDDWVIIERERLRQRVMHAIEALSRELRTRGRHVEAERAARTAAAAAPLRESAQRVLMESLLARGNDAGARATFAEFRARLQRELGVEPSPALAELVVGDLPTSAVGGG